MYYSVESEKLCEALDFGKTCKERVPGEGPWYDVDGEDVSDESYASNTQLYEAIKAWRLFEKLRDNP